MWAYGPVSEIHKGFEIEIQGFGLVSWNQPRRLRASPPCFQILNALVRDSLIGFRPRQVLHLLSKVVRKSSAHVITPVFFCRLLRYLCGLCWKNALELLTIS